MAADRSPFDSDLALSLELQAGEILARKAAANYATEFEQILPRGVSRGAARMGAYVANWCREQASGPVQSGQVDAVLGPEILIIHTYAASSRIGLMHDPFKLAPKVRGALYEAITPLVGGPYLTAGLTAYKVAFETENVALGARVACERSGFLDPRAIGPAASVVMFHVVVAPAMWDVMAPTFSIKRSLL